MKNLYGDNLDINDMSLGEPDEDRQERLDCHEIESEATRIFDETNFRSYMIQDVANWCKNNHENLQAAKRFAEGVFYFVPAKYQCDYYLNDCEDKDLVEEIISVLDYVPDKIIMDFCFANDISIQRPYIVYLENGEYYDEYWSEEDFIKGFDDFVNEDTYGLYAIVMHERDGIFHSGIINEKFKTAILEKINAFKAKETHKAKETLSLK